MSLLVTGSIAFDSVSTPFGRAEDVLGGTAVYFSLAASYYVPVRLVAVVGEDFPEEHRRVLAERRIDLSGLEVRPGAQTFRWTGRYEGAMNEAQTLDVRLNVLAEAPPAVPEAFRDSRFVFLANTHPALQKDLAAQLDAPTVVVCDTMNLWIETEKEALLDTLAIVDGVIINDGEARLLTGRVNLIEAGEEVMALGPRFVIIKKGEHGSVLISEEGVTAIPAFPARKVVDPTGAGDSFAGGLMGHLAAVGRCDPEALRSAMVRGTVAASFAIEDFSMNRVRTLTRGEIDRRVGDFLRMLRLE
ncbi:MAG: sugar kinase [Phycisphaerales bacterium]|nr:MAG: sugar kinase [Phycisphaerales bacterium]